MSLRVDSATDVLEAGARPTAFTAFTLAGYSQVVSDTGSVGRQLIVSMYDVEGVDAVVYLDWDSDGTNVMRLGNFPPGSDAAFGSRPAVGDWFHWWVRYSSGSVNYQGGWARIQDAYVTVDVGSSITIGVAVPNHLTYGSYGFTDENTNIRWCNLRAWNVALTDAEIAWERYSSVAVRRANLVFDVPGDSATLAEALKDFSGAGATMTHTTASADPEAPPTFDLFHSAANWGKFSANTAFIHAQLNGGMFDMTGGMQ